MPNRSQLQTEFSPSAHDPSIYTKKFVTHGCDNSYPIRKTGCLVAHAVEMLHRQVVDVKKSLDAVGQTCFLGLVELGVLDVARNTLVPAHLGQAVGF
jgi:hypothetical protein